MQKTQFTAKDFLPEEALRKMMGENYEEHKDSKVILLYENSYKINQGKEAHNFEFQIENTPYRFIMSYEGEHGANEIYAPEIPMLSASQRKMLETDILPAQEIYMDYLIYQVIDNSPAGNELAQKTYEWVQGEADKYGISGATLLGSFNKKNILNDLGKYYFDFKDVESYCLFRNEYSLDFINERDNIDAYDKLLQASLPDHIYRQIAGDKDKARIAFEYMTNCATREPRDGQEVISIACENNLNCIYNIKDKTYESEHRFDSYGDSDGYNYNIVEFCRIK